MSNSYEFLSLILDAITEHIVVIDEAGEIKFVNESWSKFGSNNACVVAGSWTGVNYLAECDKASAQGDEFGTVAGIGIRSVIEKRQSLFYFEYPCHSPDEERWFTMRVSPFTISDNNYFVITHQNITERKLAENEVLKLFRIDALTNLANRRHFNEFLKNEWQRCNRLGMPISLALIDLDHFKLLNDTYGHQAGDECLKSVGRILKKFGKRPNDICARYGGEEFVILYGGTGLKQAEILIRGLLDEIRSLNIPNEKSPTLPTLTASVGLAAMLPNNDNNECELISRSDELLYTAKKSGRNRICFN